MPRDKWGRVAHLIVDDLSTVKRMNLGRVYEQGINAAADYVSMHIREWLSNSTDVITVDKAWDYLMQFYATVTPPMYEFIKSVDSVRKMEHLRKVCDEPMRLYLPTDNPVKYSDVINALKLMYPDLYGQVTFLNEDGDDLPIDEKTKDDMLIGSMYIMVLEKTATQLTATASSKMQHWGIPAKISNSDKYSKPYRDQATRVGGEAENRHLWSYVGGDVPAELIDQTNNPSIHQIACDSILIAPNPMDIERFVDRTKYPIGYDRIMNCINHIMVSSGKQFVRNRG